LSGENPTSSLHNSVLDFTLNSQATMNLPQGVYDEIVDAYQILLMVSVSDNLGAISNIT
jgi:hypothetical protein